MRNPFNYRFGLPSPFYDNEVGSFTAFSPSTLFAANEPGVWFDPSDLTTLYQDPAGTIPVTGPTGPTGLPVTVGLMLDKSRGLALGPELVVNGDFSDGTTTGWTPQALATISVEDGQLKAISSGPADTGVWQALTTVVGRTYRLTASLRGTAGALSVAAYNGAFSTLLAQNTNYPETGVLTEGSLVFTAIGTTTRVIFSPGGTATTYYADNISVKELPGNHATQATTANRPIYGVVPATGRRNVYTFTEDFTNAAWLKLNSPTLTDQGGGVWRLQASAGSSILYQTIPASGVHTIAFDVKSNGAGLDGFRFMLQGGYTGGDFAATSEWVRYSTSGTNSGSGAAGIASSSTLNALDILIRFPQLELGSTATAYQKVTNQYDVTEAGVASMSYLYFDGVNDAMATSTITPGIDKAQVFSGVRKLDAAGPDVVVELSANSFSNDGSLALFAPYSGSLYEVFTRGTVAYAWQKQGTYAAPITNVVQASLDNSKTTTATQIVARVDGSTPPVVTNQAGPTSAGNYLAYPLYIGGRAAASLFFNGHLYSLITRFGANLDAPTITSTEIWVGDKTGIDVAKNISTTIYTRSGDTILDRANSIIERRTV